MNSGKGNGPLLDQDTFQNQRSQQLFDAIDELRRCTPALDLDLPEVLVFSHVCGLTYILIDLVARCYWRSIRREIVLTTEPNGHTISSCRKIMYALSDPDHLSEVYWQPGRQHYLYRAVAERSLSILWIR